MTDFALGYQLVDILLIMFTAGFIIGLIGFARAVFSRRRYPSKCLPLHGSRPLRQRLHTEEEVAIKRGVQVMNEQAQEMSTHMQHEANRQLLLHNVMQQHQNE